MHPGDDVAGGAEAADEVQGAGGDCPSATMSTGAWLASGSRHSCTMPVPCGPSRSQVGGTRSQASASETAYAATSRAASVPSGKSQSGRSPATGL